MQDTYDALEAQILGGDYERARQFIDGLRQTLQNIESALQEKRLDFILNVWRGTCQSMLSWTSPPAWYQVPATFLSWHEQAQEHAEGIGNPFMALLRLPCVVRDLRGVDERAREEHHRILDELESLAGAQELHEEMTALMGGLSWAAFVP